MKVKRQQNTYEKVQLEEVENSNFFHKRDANLPPHSNLTKEKKNPKVTKPNTKANSTNTKNQINIRTKISIKIAIK